MTESPLEFTGERFVPGPEMDYRLVVTHEHRYHYALEFTRGQVVLDFGCGEGYGVEILSRNADRSIGYDPSNVAISHARKRWAGYPVEFTSRSDDVATLAGSVDVVTCMEVLEHAADPDTVLGPIKHIMSANGILLLSTPNKLKYQDERKNDNPFHVHEYYYDELNELLRKYFLNVWVFGQEYVAGSMIYPLEGSSSASRLVGPGRLNPPVSDGFFAVCSDISLPKTFASHMLPDSLSRSDDVVDGVPRTQLMGLLEDFDLERTRAQNQLNEYEELIERLSTVLKESDEREKAVRQTLAEYERELAWSSEAANLRAPIELLQPQGRAELGVESSSSDDLTQELEALRNRLEAIERSRSYRIGSLIASPVRLFRRLVGHIDKGG